MHLYTHVCIHAVNEAPAIIAAPLQGRYIHQGPRFSATCVAYGSPRPDVWFGSEALGIANFRDVSDFMINVYSQDINLDGYIFVATTLEVCGADNDLDFYERYLTEYECYTSNGVMADSSAVGVRAVEFKVQPIGKYNPQSQIELLYCINECYFIIIINYYDHNYHKNGMEFTINFGSLC